MRIAIFSDIHGKILFPFKLVKLYQKETNEKIDFILQCGDIGCYPDINNLDKATIKHAKNDRDELGFYDSFTEEIPEIKNFLDELNVNMICVRGNHEDHEYLDKIEGKSHKSMFPIDIYNRVFVCKTGVRQELKKGNETLSFVGVGRIGDRKGRNNSRFIQEYEKKAIKTLIKESKQIFDVLITHDKDDGSERGYGMKEIGELLNNVIFKYHFYGHTGEPYNQEVHTNGITKSIKIKEAEFNKSGILEKGAMIILEKIDSKVNLKIVEQKLTNKLSKYNWKI
ncbi:metallophosphoesterase [Tenacibaculum finnmarkense]|uniref:metallophosphoesterase family protein n=1 Tax=Tenacibaculum finnmarkense TaxID=2781243 RepID=UPI00187B6AB3|nr:metallophosphoesterase [Tenacibaculum finnmarkense]MBE7661515.1 serine/threonine protein phosphatase [Tenacibaculum finnmarkense genomovar finnmarkense]MCG8253236.1 metallophosphoesterase [Tenacibaculum finnmarkense genomovar finnmarkense]MCG8816743.1 metallophosphoesterase [Tenacibaculum finnmarkense]MCG8821735.1 metallophosphoesterase [Tenacibaculum finnmarkense]